MLDVAINEGIQRQANALAERNRIVLDEHSVPSYERFLCDLVRDFPGVEESTEFENIAKFVCVSAHHFGDRETKRRVAETALSVIHQRNLKVGDVEDMANLHQGALAKLKAGTERGLAPVQVVYLALELDVPLSLLFEDFSNQPEALAERLGLERRVLAESTLAEARSPGPVVRPTPPPSEETTVAVTEPPKSILSMVSHGESVLGTPLRIKISKVHPDPENPRRRFDPDSLEELADSIQAKGQETPASVTKDPDVLGQFMLVSGERRLRALNIIWERLGRTPETEPTIDCFIKVIKGGAHARLLHAFMENTQRENMPVLDEAAGLAKLRAGGESIADLAKASGYSDSMVRNLIAIDGLPDEVKALMEPDLPRSQRLNTTTAIDLTQIKSPAVQIELAREAVERQLGVQETRFLIQQRGGQGPKSIIRSGHERSPKERYAGLARYLGRTTAWVKKFMQDGRDPIDDMFFHRELEDDDRSAMVKEIDHLIAWLEKLRDIVKAPPSK